MGAGIFPWKRNVHLVTGDYFVISKGLESDESTIQKPDQEPILKGGHLCLRHKEHRYPGGNLSKHPPPPSLGAVFFQGEGQVDRVIRYGYRMPKKPILEG